MSTSQIAPTWADTELPLLRAAVQADLQGENVRTAVMSQAVALGLNERQIGNCLEALFDGDYFDGEFIRMGAGHYVAHIRRPAERARRAVGQWPSEELFLADLAASLMAAADAQQDQEEAGALRRTARWVGAFASNAGANAAGTMLAALASRYTG
ncbi:MAG: hypothetical protein ABMA25_27615 [Ilumatobacteraceae bacterium]